MNAADAGDDTGTWHVIAVHLPCGLAADFEEVRALVQ
jgi:hypothetical protein